MRKQLVTIVQILVMAALCYVGTTGFPQMTMDDYNRFADHLLESEFARLCYNIDELGDPNHPAIRFTRQYYKNKFCTDKKDDNPALLVKASRMGEPNAQSALGYLYKESDPHRAMALFRQAAGQGEVQAMLELAKLILQHKKNYENEYFSLLEQAAATGDPSARAMYGMNLALLEKDIQQGRRLLLEAAKEGQGGAQMVLLSMLKSDPSWVSPTDLNEILLLANKGNSRLFRMVGEMYENGIGVEQNLNVAWNWYGKALLSGDMHSLAKLHWLNDTFKRQATP